MAWPVVCGSAVAERTHALTFGWSAAGGRARCQDGKSELQGLAPRYLAVINQYTLEAVRRIEFVMFRAENTPS